MGNTQYQTFKDNKHSVDDKIWLLERYLLASSKKEFFQSLVASSEIFKYMRYSDYLNNPDEYDQEELEKELVNYLVSLDNCLKDEINFKYLAQKAASETDKQKRKEILMKMNKLYFKTNFDFKPPVKTQVLEEPQTLDDNQEKPKSVGKISPSQISDLLPEHAIKAVENFELKKDFGQQKKVT
jgi:hypothetical protein